MCYQDKVLFHNFLTGMRNGKNVTLEQLCHGLCSISMMKRIENGERLPDKLLRDRLMDRLGIANDGFEDFLQPDEYALWKNRQELLYAVETENTAKAECLIKRYERENKGKNIEQQFYLVMKAQIMECQGASHRELCKIYEEALELTIPDVSLGKWQHRLLAAQEWNLLLEYICHGGDAGIVVENRSTDTDREKAYEELLTAVQNSAMDPGSCAKIYPKVAYYLCLEHMKSPQENWPCQRLLQVCIRAVEMLRSANRTYYLCELLEITEHILAVLVKQMQKETGACFSESVDTILNRLAGKPMEKPNALESFDSLKLLLAQIQEWHQVLTELFRDYKIPEKMENCCYLYYQTLNYRIGDVVRKRRRMLGMSVRDLCDGICSEKTLRRLENNKNKIQMVIAGKLFEKMGLPPEYQRKKIITERYDAITTYSLAVKSLVNCDFETMEKALSQLKNMLNMDIIINRQEIDCLDSLYKYHNKQITKKECVLMLKNALEYTVPLENIDSFTEIYLTCAELECLYNIALKKEEKENYMKLLEDICTQYITQNGMRPFINIYELIMCGVASYLGNIGKYEKSHKITEQIIAGCLSMRRMNVLHICLYNKLWNQMECSRRGTSTEPVIPIKRELQKCVQLSHLCRDKFYKKFYLHKVEEICNQ